VSRRKKHAGHVNHERWLVSYADFITLLFAFFVVMFASSQVDKRKVGQIALAVQVAFQHLGVFPTSDTHLNLSEAEPMPFSKAQLVVNSIRSTDLGRIADGPHGETQPTADEGMSTGLSHVVRKALAPEIRAQKIKLFQSREGLVISLQEIGFFDSGEATLKPGSLASLAKIAQILVLLPNDIRIEGNTDNVPIHNAQFASNWELSTARATKLVAIFIGQYHFPPMRLSAAGYAQYHPVASNATPAGRALNRRVDIVVLNAPPAASRSPRANLPAATAADLSKAAPIDLSKAAQPQVAPVPSAKQPPAKSSK
jgi:chemotaxis protein MotB